MVKINQKAVIVNLDSDTLKDQVIQNMGASGKNGRKNKNIKKKSKKK